MNASSTIIGVAKKFVWVFPNILWKNLNKLLSQPLFYFHNIKKVISTK